MVFGHCMAGVIWPCIMPINLRTIPASFKRCTVVQLPAHIHSIEKNPKENFLSKALICPQARKRKGYGRAWWLRTLTLSFYSDAAGQPHSERQPAHLLCAFVRIECVHNQQNALSTHRIQRECAICGNLTMPIYIADSARVSYHAFFHDNRDAEKLFVHVVICMHMHSITGYTSYYVLCD